MSLSINGPGPGESIGRLHVRNAENESVALEQIPGRTLVVDVFRGHW